MRWPALSTAYAVGTVVAAGVRVATTMLFILFGPLEAAPWTRME